jgi:chromosome segregation ATPase
MSNYLRTQRGVAEHYGFRTQHPLDADPNDPNPDLIETQETQVEHETQENPAVSKLREAFDTARNAIIEGSELAKQVEELSLSVRNLTLEVSSLQRDLEYVRSRNRELDEQVTQVRQARDNAISEAQGHSQRANVAEAALADALHRLESMARAHDVEVMRFTDLATQRDDAMVMALEYETKLKEAEAKLAKIEEAMHGIKSDAKAEAQKPHWVDQPRDEVGKFEPTEYKTGTQGNY